MASIQKTIHPPVPDPAIAPKPSQEMAAEGDREGPVHAPSQPDEIETERDPQFARNGE